MVTVRRVQTVTEASYADLASWLDSVRERCSLDNMEALEKACQWARDCQQHGAVAKAAVGEGETSPLTESNKPQWDYEIDGYRIGLEMAEILADLRADQEALIAAILYRAVREEKLTLVEVEKEFGSAISGIIEGVLRMAAISAVLNPGRRAVLGQQEAQLDNVRRMLVALIDDVRVALVKLAERTVIIRAVKNAGEERRQKVAREVFDIYAPLAHRLGVGQLKWELEDVSFRYLQPGPYKKIARLLDEKRLDRENYIETVIGEINNQLERAGIHSEVQGRAKHIYSIWRKMQKKHIDFYEVYDVRAVRILVDEVRDCYAVLGIVHSLWNHVPTEFDDYIANPKENGYQSLHTAVVGPERKMLEIQIRTQKMHEDAELGVCAHWRYKEGVSGKNSQQDYDKRIAWLREVLAWHDELGEAGLENIVDDFRHGNTDERVYVFTPEGHVIDLETGATPIDFAYQVHTEIGHRCRGAKVNGHIVPLSYQLNTGEQVEILTTRDGGPSRDWLTASLGYVKTHSARAKIQQWFKRQDRGEHITQGRQIFDKESNRLALDRSLIDLEKLAPRFNLHSKDDLLAALGRGDLRPGQLFNVINEELAPEARQQEFRFPAPSKRKTDKDEIIIEGVGNLLTHMAACCQPVPGDVIMGYITQGRGVTVHRADCHNLLSMQADDPERIIEVSWGHASDITYPVDIYIKAWDRPGLLRDVMSVLANDRFNVTAVHTESHPSDNTATMLLTVEISSLGKLGKLLAHLDQLPAVQEVRRYKK